VSTPGPGDGRFRPGAPSGGGPGSYGGPGEPTKYPHGQQSPYGQPSSPYAYSPYGAPYQPPPDEAKPAPRPGILWLGLILLLLSAAPFMLLGFVVLTRPLDASNLSAETMAQLQQFNLTVEQVVSAFRSVGAVFGGFAVLYVLLGAWAVFTGNKVVRILVGVLTVGFALLLVASLVLLGAADPTSSAFIGAVLLASVIGTVILFLPANREYFTGRRAR
jgi:hypothetical protein